MFIYQILEFNTAANGHLRPSDLHGTTEFKQPEYIKFGEVADKPPDLQQFHINPPSRNNKKLIHQNNNTALKKKNISLDNNNSNNNSNKYDKNKISKPILTKSNISQSELNVIRNNVIEAYKQMKEKRILNRISY